MLVLGSILCVFIACVHMHACVYMCMHVACEHVCISSHLPESLYFLSALTSCCRISLGPNCQERTNDLWHLPAILEAKGFEKAKSLRDGAGTQDRYILTEKKIRYKVSPGRVLRKPA